MRSLTRVCHALAGKDWLRFPPNPLADYLCGGTAEQEYARHKGERDAERRLRDLKWKLIQHVYGKDAGDRDAAIEMLEEATLDGQPALSVRTQEWSGRQYALLETGLYRAALIWLDTGEIEDDPKIVYPMIAIFDWDRYIRDNNLRPCAGV